MSLQRIEWRNWRFCNGASCKTRKTKTENETEKRKNLTNHDAPEFDKGCLQYPGDHSFAIYSSRTKVPPLLKTIKLQVHTGIKNVRVAFGTNDNKVHVVSLMFERNTMDRIGGDRYKDIKKNEQGRPLFATSGNQAQYVVDMALMSSAYAPSLK